METPMISRCLGKKPYVKDSRDKALKNYLDKRILAKQVPAALNMATCFAAPDGSQPAWDGDVLGNDTCGCCVLAGPGHMTTLVGALTGKQSVVTADMVKSIYSKLTGYDPVTGANDNGYVIRDMLNYWKSTGLYGHKILCYAAVDYKDPDEVAIAQWLGCGVIGGFALPVASQGQVDDQGRQLWSVPKGGWPLKQGPGTWGGHCIFVPGTSPGMDEGNSWGEPTQWTIEWRSSCCDEMWLVILDDWAVLNGKSPVGFALQDLLNDVASR
jgi:hypothetical protein